MIKVSVFYPNNEGVRFDMDYYRDVHFPLVQAKLGSACKGVAVERGLAGGAPGSKPPFIALGHMYFDSVEVFEACMAQHGAEIMKDVPNYTNLQPDLQISEVVIARESVAAA